MSLGSLDLLIVAHFGFNASFPWWLWGLSILEACMSASRLEKFSEVLELAKARLK